MQASGYGSGDSTYEDMEGMDEVKKVVEERVYTMVCTDTHSAVLNLYLAGLALFCQSFVGSRPTI